MKYIPEVVLPISSLFQEDENILSFKLKKIIFQGLKEVISDKAIGDKTGIKLADVKIEHPQEEYYGDYSSNIAMILAGRLRMKPFDIATLLKNKLDEYIKEYQSTSSISDSNIIPDSQRGRNVSGKLTENIVDRAEVAGQGFLNLWLRKDYLITQTLRVIIDENGVRSTSFDKSQDKQINLLSNNPPLKGKKIAVEYTDPNPFKEFHLGHLYSNVIGEAVSRLYEACGAEVWRGNFYGDVGMHVSKSVWGMMKKIKDQKSDIKDLEKLPISERQKFLGEGYTMGVKKYEGDKDIAEEIKDINYLVYVAAQDILKKEKGWQPIINYRQYVKGKEKELAEVYPVYEAGLRWSLEYFETIYKRLGTKFDGYYPESWVGEYGMRLVEKGLKMGVLEKSDGTVVYRGEKDGLHTRVFVNKLGLPTYEAKDLGLAQAKYQDFPYDLSINVFGKEIDEYYKVVRAAMIKIIPDLGRKAHYIAHGMVKLPQGKMSSRTGNVITCEWLLMKAKKQTLKIMKKVDVLEDEKELVAETVGLGAVRYALLKSSPVNDVIFDFDKSVSFEGDSGPYLQYTYARCKSVLRKSQDGNSKFEIRNSKLKSNYQFNNEVVKDTWKVAPPSNVAGTFDVPLDDSLEGEELAKRLNPEELSLLRTIYRFPEVVTEGARTLSPNLVCSFLFDLAQKYNLFYNKHSILGLRKNQEPRTKNREQESDKYTFGEVARRDVPYGTSRRVYPVRNSPDGGGTNRNIGVDESVRQLRLALTSATATILNRGLHLLGIETVERM